MEQKNNNEPQQIDTTSAAIATNTTLPAVHSGEITERDYLRASCRLLEQDWLHFYSDASLLYFRQIIKAWETVHPNGR